MSCLEVLSDKAVRSLLHGYSHEERSRTGQPVKPITVQFITTRLKIEGSKPEFVISNPFSLIGEVFRIFWLLWKGLRILFVPTPAMSYQRIFSFQKSGGDEY